MKKLILIAACFVILATSGCGTTNQVDVDRIYQRYVAQERSAPSFQLTGRVKIELLETNSTMTVSNQLAPLSLRSASPSVAEKTIDKLGTVAGIGLGAYFANDALKAVANARPFVTDPKIVEQQVLVPVAGAGQ